MVKSEPKKKLPLGGFFQKFFRKPEKSEKEQRLTVQRSIPYLEMGRDGICRVEEHLYSKTVRFYDINYQLAQNEDKNTIFESWCDFLNYFDASIRFQLSFINHKSDMSEYNKVIQIEPQHDQFDDVRMEYAQMLKQQLAKGNNGLVRTKYITFSIEAKSVREAKPRLERIETDILNNFKVLGVKAYPLNGVERLQIMYETFHQEEQQKFDFSYDRILQSGMTTKDFIAPTSFLFKSGKDFMMGDTYGAASYLNILAPELTDKVLAEFLDITNDGRKLALDQRLINDMLPDEPESKVNRCVDNAFKVWEESAPDKGTQLIFCDLSTPKADGTFNVYDDVREKLVARGVPREEVAFIHEYNTETKKAELFAKVRAGQVRILMGSTPKLGAGTNIQDRLIALHHLDCPWKPSDLEQQEGRILRQGNRNKQVKIYRYVTENTFDSYMWQILENKQKFISQIMTSKSPVRACDDVDDTALSYAEIKALATGNPYIKEKMDLDIQVSKLKLLKANHTSQIYSLELDIARRYPREIAVAQGQIEALKTDMEATKPLLAQDKDHFSMEISGKVYTERKEAGAAIIEACKALKAAGTEGRIGNYGAFELHSRFDNFDKVFRLSIKGAWNYSMEVGKDPQGNILRVTNALAGIERTLPQVERRLETLEQQLAQAKEEAKRPFAQEAELAEKSARLAELNSLLNMDEKGSEDALGVDEDAAETEVADKPRQPVNYAGRVAERTADNMRKPSVLAQLHAKQAERTAEPQNPQKRKSHDMEL